MEKLTGEICTLVNKHESATLRFELYVKLKICINIRVNILKINIYSSIYFTFSKLEEKTSFYIKF